ncbi:MAG: TonB-dependent receptor, partial [Pseudomonadota bacterium]
MRFPSSRAFRNTLISSTAVGFAALPAAAQVGADETDAGSILVTARASGQSITTLGEEELNLDRASDSLEDVLRRVPNINTLGVQNGFINIRGENAEGAGNSAAGIIPGRLIPTPVTIDRRPLAYGEITFGATSVYDVQAIEVVRGPQTTGGGINGAIGAINLVTADPTSETEVELVAEYGSFDQYQLAGLVSGELVEGQLFARLVVDYNFRDTILEYTNPNLLPIPEIFEFNQLNARAKAVWLPGGADDLRFELSYTYTESDGPQTENANLIDGEFLRSSSNVAAFLNTGHAVTFETSYDFSDAAMLLNTLTWSTSDLTRISGNGTFRLDQRTYDIQNETQLTFATDDGRFEFSPGAIVRFLDVDMDWDFFGPGPADDERLSVGVYGEGIFRPTSELTILAGLRYQREEQERVGFLGLNTPETLSNPTIVDFDESFDAALPRLSIDYDVSEDINIGFFAARGFTPGGFSFVRPTAAQGRGDGVTPFFLPTFNPETRWVYEAFMRSSLLDNRIELSANIFYTDISDVQLFERVEFAPDIFGSVVRNAEKAETYGLELSLSAEVSEWLSLSGSLGLTETEIVEFSDAPGVEGNELERAPGVTANIGIDLTPVEGFSVGASLNH